METRLLIYENDFARFFESLSQKSKQYFYDGLFIMDSLGLDPNVVPYLKEIPHSRGLMELTIFCEEGEGGILCFDGYDGRIIVAVGYIRIKGQIPPQSLSRAEQLREQYFLNE
ncbi:MAG: hypothetical protein AAF587_27930 [Bacteroidota bacterium]